MLDGAKAGSLVLMDEMGSGTDPMQGAALAQSLLEVTQSNADNNIFIYIYLYIPGMYHHPGMVERSPSVTMLVAGVVHTPGRSSTDQIGHLQIDRLDPFLSVGSCCAGSVQYRSNAGNTC